jgi:hypothetical protein
VLSSFSCNPVNPADHKLCHTLLNELKVDAGEEIAADVVLGALLGFRNAILSYVLC